MRACRRSSPVFSSTPTPRSARSSRRLSVGQRDNTLIIYRVGDNGPSAEGSLTCTLNNMKSQNGFPHDVATIPKKSDENGGAEHENHYPFRGAGPDRHR